ncbi:MAG TPA: hypothetical protein VKD43_16150, partial [Xanthobacteraceae bacterium]|nr:hypothetical protein [Xanthobacteraceae bacterium]
TTPVLGQMTADVIHIDDVASRFERDRKAFRLRLNGVPVWQIAETLQCSAHEVDASLKRMCAGVTPELRSKTVELDLERLDDLMQVYFLKARGGDKEAANLVIRMMDRQSRFLGLDVLPQATAARDQTREPKGFEKIREAIYRVARGPVIDGEAVEVKDNKDDKSG